MKTVLVPLAQGCEELEAVTIIDLLRRAGVTVVSAGLDGQPVRGSRGTVLVPDTTLDLALNQDFDLVALPGGQPGTNNLKADARIIALVQRMAREDKYVAAVCAAPSVLATAGLLDGRRATSFPGYLDGFPKVQQQQAAVVEDGRFITSRGPGTAMDFALALVERLAGRAKRDEVEAGLQR
jgi:4-methyl-5(b-hydroxyethyl)-thiazole monophosphate biosynthesis